MYSEFTWSPLPTKLSSFLHSQTFSPASPDVESQGRGRKKNTPVKATHNASRRVSRLALLAHELIVVKIYLKEHKKSYFMNR